MKYINLLLIKKIFLLLFFLSYSPGINGKNILASYEIMWGPLVLGNIKWEYRITTTEYKFIIELKNSKIASKLYPFYGKHVSEGVVKNGNFVSKKYTQTWKTRKKDRYIEVVLENNKVFSFIIMPKQTRPPFINFYDLIIVTDPIAAALELIINNDKNLKINNDKKIVKNVFDGRRIYDLSLKNKRAQTTYLNEKIVEHSDKYDLDILNYKNIWKDHNKTDLKKVEVLSGMIEEDLIIPLDFIIYNKGLVFKIKYIDHTVLN